MQKPEPIADILVVEDNPGDVRLTQRALDAGSAVRHRLHVVEDGEMALAFLRRDPPHEEAPRPDLVLLDLNLPKTDGREVLGAIKADEDLRRIPIVVLSTSSALRDIRDSYDLHANCFVTKPLHLAEYVEVIRRVTDFWLRVASPPPKH